MIKHLNALSCIELVIIGGLVLASAWIVLRAVERRSVRRWSASAHPVAWLVGVGSAALAIGLVAMAASRAIDPSEHGDWAIGVYLSQGADPLDFVPLGPQPVITAADVTDLPCAFVADPVLVRDDDGRYVLFFEAWNARTDQGDICVATSVDGRSWRYGGRVLDEGCSMSYPTVFRFEGQWYMVPETRALDELRLYRARRFPDQWEFDRVLLTDGAYRDSNVVEHDGRWYLLTMTGPACDLLVYHADTPLGPWRPLAGNPVVRDDGDLARGGGSVVAHGGRLLRFVQDVFPYYGNCVRGVEVLALSPDAYEQAPVRTEPILQGHDDWNVRGMHMLWCVPGDDGRWLAAVDGHGRLVNTRAGWLR